MTLTFISKNAEAQQDFREIEKAVDYGDKLVLSFFDGTSKIVKKPAGVNTDAAVWGS